MEAHATSRPELTFARPRWARGWALLVIPGVAFLGLFFGWPLVDMAVRSLTDPGTSNYRLFTDTSVYRDALVTTFRVAGVTTLVCLLLGYPYAYVMNRVSSRAAFVLGALVLVPFWSSLLVRAYAWTVWLQDTGLINTLLQHLGITHSPVALMRNSIGTTIGMTHIMLPYMVLSLYAGMRRIDPELTTAAESLGARPFTAFRRIFLPLSKPGIYTGCLLVFVISLGFYITPELLGDPSHALIGQLIVDQVSSQQAFGAASALGMVLLLLTLIVIAMSTRVVNLGHVVGYDES
jgi:putative spermidine/putrescine transport system permease protein